MKLTIENGILKKCALEPGKTKLAIPEEVTCIENGAFRDCKERLTELSLGSEAEACKELVELLAPEAVVQNGPFTTTRDGKILIRYDASGINPEAIEDPEILSLDLAAISPEQIEEIFTPERLAYLERKVNPMMMELTFNRAQMEAIERLRRKYTAGLPEEAAVPEGVTHIAAEAFGGRRELRRVSLPGSVTSIGFSAFENCTALEELELSAGLKAIGNAAFGGCKALKRLAVPAGVRQIRGQTFRGCEGLEALAFAEGLTEFERNDLKRCEHLQALRLPQSLKCISCRAEFPKHLCHILPEGLAALKDVSSSAYPYSGMQMPFDPDGKLDGDFVKYNLQSIARLLHPRTLARLIVNQKGKPVQRELQAAFNGSLEYINFPAISEAVTALLREGEVIAPENAAAFHRDYLDKLDAAHVRAFVEAVQAKKLDKKLKTFLSDQNVKALLSGGAKAGAGSMEAAFPERIAAAGIGMAEIRQTARALVKGKAIPSGLSYVDGSAVSTEAFSFLALDAGKSGGSQPARDLIATFDAQRWAEALHEIAQKHLYRAEPLLAKLVCIFGDDADINALISEHPRWSKWSLWGRPGKELDANFMRWLMCSDTRAALVYCDKKGRLRSYAEARGTTEAALRAKLVEDFGFDAQGARVFRAGADEIEAKLLPDASIYLTNRATGKVVKSFPKKGEPNDAEAFAKWKKELSTVVKSRVKALREAFESGAKTDVALWRDENLLSPIYAALARGLVWQADEDLRFRLNASGEALNLAGEAVALPEGAKISVVHPVDLTREELRAWREVFLDIPQPVPQLTTPVRLPAPETLEERYMGCMVMPRALERLGVDEDGAITGGNRTVQAIIINRHDFYKPYPVCGANVYAKAIGDRRRYSTDILQMDNLLDPFSKAREAAAAGDVEKLRRLAEIELIAPENVFEMIDLAAKAQKAEASAYLLNLAHAWGAEREDALL